MADLSNLARQAASRAGFVAYRLAEYQRTNNLDDTALATRLGCTLDDLTHLRLCGRPRSDHFSEDVARIARHVHADADALGRLLSVT
jgi:hypothetical protein